jgi:hypothetical protein
VLTRCKSRSGGQDLSLALRSVTPPSANRGTEQRMVIVAGPQFARAIPGDLIDKGEDLLVAPVSTVKEVIPSRKPSQDTKKVCEKPGCRSDHRRTVASEAIISLKRSFVNLCRSMVPRKLPLPPASPSGSKAYIVTVSPTRAIPPERLAIPFCPKGVQYPLRG